MNKQQRCFFRKLFAGDIKPDNLMLVAPCGESPLVIIDFGLSLYIGDAKGYQSKWSVGSMLYVRHFRCLCWSH